MPDDEEFDASTSSVAQSELPRDVRLILSAVQRSSILIKEVCSYAKDILTTSTDATLDTWRAIELSNMMTEEESNDAIIQRKCTYSSFRFYYLIQQVTYCVCAFVRLSD